MFSQISSFQMMSWFTDTNMALWFQRMLQKHRDEGFDISQHQILIMLKPHREHVNMLPYLFDAIFSRWQRCQRWKPIYLWWVLIKHLCWGHTTPFTHDAFLPWMIYSSHVFLWLMCTSMSSVDYESLRIGGLAFAVVLFALGILLILSKLTSMCVTMLCHEYNTQLLLSSVTIKFKRTAFPHYVCNLHHLVSTLYFNYIEMT